MRKIQFTLIALLAAGVATPLLAVPPKKAPKPESIIETTAANVLLPQSASGLLVVKECSSCPPRSFAVTSSTMYRLNERPVGLAEFRNTLVGRPRININVVLSAKSQQLLFLDATSETGLAPAPARNKAK